MNFVYTVIYIHTDDPKLSETLGVFISKEKAIEHLIERAGYREKSNGQLTQYMQSTDEYDSLEDIRQIVNETNELVDEDIFRIERLTLN